MTVPQNCWAWGHSCPWPPMKAACKTARHAAEALSVSKTGEVRARKHLPRPSHPCTLHPEAGLQPGSGMVTAFCQKSPAGSFPRAGPTLALNPSLLFPSLGVILKTSATYSEGSTHSPGTTLLCASSISDVSPLQRQCSQPLLPDLKAPQELSATVCPHFGEPQHSSDRAARDADTEGGCMQ